MNSRSTRLRLLVDRAADGLTNMATDEVLLEAAAERGQAAVRLYRWNSPTLSLGYFQNLSARDQHESSRYCAVVRRRSGGGAIVHDHEWTYSVAIPLSHLPGLNPTGLYRLVHVAWCAVLQRATGLPVQMLDCRAPQSTDAFLCFQRRSTFDLLVGDHKILGSAQRRFRNAVLQHGSLLLARSAAAPELPGLAELVESPPEWDVVMDDWLEEIAGTFGSTYDAAPLADEERQRVDYHLARFGSHDWIARRA